MRITKIKLGIHLGPNNRRFSLSVLGNFTVHEYRRALEILVENSRTAAISRKTGHEIGRRATLTEGLEQ